MAEDWNGHPALGNESIERGDTVVENPEMKGNAPSSNEPRSALEYLQLDLLEYQIDSEYTKAVYTIEVIGKTNHIALQKRISEKQKKEGCYAGYAAHILDHAEWFFSAEEGILYVLGTDIKFHFRNYFPNEESTEAKNEKEIELNYLHALNDSTQYIYRNWQLEDMRAVYEKLRYCTFSEYYKALVHFKRKTKLLFFPWFDRPEELSIINGVLCIEKKVGSLNESNTWDRLAHPEQAARNDLPFHLFPKPYTYTRPLTKKDVEDKIRNYHGRVPDDEWKTKRFIKLLIEAKKSASKQDKNSVNKQYMLADKDDECSISYRSGQLRYIPSLESAEALIGSEPMKGLKVQTADLSDDFKSALYTICGGSKQGLDDLAELFARTFSEFYPSEYIWHICGPHGADFHRWFKSIVNCKYEGLPYNTGLYDNRNYYGGPCSSTVYASDNARSKFLLQDYFDHVLFQFNYMPPSEEEFKAINHAMLSRLIKENVLNEIDEPFQDMESLEYHPVIMLLTDWTSKEPFGKLPRKVICPEGKWNTDLKPNEQRWIMFCLTAHGLRIISRKEQEKKPQTKVDKMKIVPSAKYIERFCKEYCHAQGPVKNEKGREERACILEADFYKNLVRYCESFPEYIKLDNKINTMKIVEELTKLSFTELKTTNPDKNKKCKMDYALDMEKLNRDIEHNLAMKDDLIKKARKEEFFRYIDTISDMVEFQ